jgi:hypothetical protein
MIRAVDAIVHVFTKSKPNRGRLAFLRGDLVRGAILDG